MVITNGTNRRALKIIQYDAQFACISRKLNDENVVSSNCVGVCVGDPEHHLDQTILFFKIFYLGTPCTVFRGTFNG